MLYVTLLLVGATAATGLGGNGYEEEVSGSSAMRTLRRQTQISRQPCVCNPQTESCSCCGRVDQTSINFHARGCGTVRYGTRRNRALRYEVSVNNRTVGRTEATATKNPVELCVPAAIFMICTKFFNVEFQNATFTFCFRFDVKYSRFTLFAVDFDCVRVALAPGIASKHHFPDRRDPEPICHPLPRFPFVEICWRFHTTNYDENGQLRFCLSVDARFSGYTFYSMNFDCTNYNTGNPESSS